MTATSLSSDRLLRPIAPADESAVLRLNQSNVDLLSPLDHSRLAQLLEWADRGDVIESGGAFAGFVLTFGPGTEYDSPNYRWFCDEYGGDFYYLDRIVLDGAFRRQGLAQWVYDELEEVARPHGRMLLEVNADPPNEASLAFHAARGYREIHRLGGHGMTVSLMEKLLG